MAQEATKPSQPQEPVSEAKPVVDGPVQTLQPSVLASPQYIELGKSYDPSEKTATHVMAKPESSSSNGAGESGDSE